MTTDSTPKAAPKISLATIAAIIFGGLSILLVIVLVAGGLYMNSELNKLKANVASLEEDLDSAEETIENKEIEIASLESENEYFSSEITRLSTPELTVEGEALTVASASTNPFSYYADSDICYENGKPVVLMFSTTWCPHCQWIKNTFDTWARANSATLTVLHYEWGEGDNVTETISGEILTEVPEAHQDMYDLYGGGYVPTFVFGCKYFRVGNGFETTTGTDAAFASEVAEYDNIASLLE